MISITLCLTKAICLGNFSKVSLIWKLLLQQFRGSYLNAHILSACSIHGSDELVLSDLTNIYPLRKVKIYNIWNFKWKISFLESWSKHIYNLKKHSLLKMQMRFSGIIRMPILMKLKKLNILYIEYIFSLKLLRKKCLYFTFCESSLTKK